MKAFLKEKVGQVLPCLKQTFSSKVKRLEAPQAVSLERKILLIFCQNQSSIMRGIVSNRHGKLILIIVQMKISKV